MGVPLRMGGRLSGVLVVAYTKPAIVTTEHLALLEAFGELAAAALRNANAAAGLAHAARTDSLTGCLNHAAFREHLRAELERSQRTKERVSVTMLDLDDFKRVNEQMVAEPGGCSTVRRCPLRATPSARSPAWAAASRGVPPSQARRPRTATSPHRPRTSCRSARRPPPRPQTP